MRRKAPYWTREKVLVSGKPNVTEYCFSMSGTEDVVAFGVTGVVLDVVVFKIGDDTGVEVDD